MLPPCAMEPSPLLAVHSLGTGLPCWLADWLALAASHGSHRLDRIDNSPVSVGCLGGYPRRFTSLPFASLFHSAEVLSPEVVASFPRSNPPASARCVWLFFSLEYIAQCRLPAIAIACLLPVACCLPRSLTQSSFSAVVIEDGSKSSTNTSRSTRMRTHWPH